MQLENSAKFSNVSNCRNISTDAGHSVRTILVLAVTQVQMILDIMTPLFYFVPCCREMSVSSFKSNHIQSKVAFRPANLNNSTLSLQIYYKYIK